MGKPRQWYILAILTFSYIVAFVDRTALPLMVEPIKADLHITDLQLSLLLGLGLTLVGSLLTIPAGWLVDRVSRRGLLLASLVAWSGMTLFCGFANSFMLLLAGRAGVGISEAGITPTGFSLIRSIFSPAHRGRAFAIFSIGPPLATGLSFLLGGAILGMAAKGVFAAVPVLGAMQGWQIVLTLYGLFGIVPLLLALTIREPARITAPVSDYRAALQYFAAHWRLYAPLFCFATLNAMLAFSISSWMPAVIGRVWHLSPPQSGLRFGPLLLIVAPVGAVLAGFAIDICVRRGYRAAPALVGFVTSALSGILIVWIMRCTTINQAYPLIALLFAVYGSFFPVGAALIARLTPDALMGKISALYLVSQTLFGQAVAPTLIVLGAHRFFTGPEAIGYSLALCGAIFTILGLVALAFAYAAIRTLERSSTS